jgi:hypothetical protein
MHCCESNFGIAVFISVGVLCVLVCQCNCSIVRPRRLEAYFSHIPPHCFSLRSPHRAAAFAVVGDLEGVCDLHRARIVSVLPHILCVSRWQAENHLQEDSMVAPHSACCLSRKAVQSIHSISKRPPYQQQHQREARIPECVVAQCGVAAIKHHAWKL